MKRMETLSRGVHRRSRRKKKNKDKNARRFDNQVTLIFKMQLPLPLPGTTQGTASSSTSVYVNVKVFKNGNIQMTGLKEVDQGIRVIEFVSEQIERIKKIDPSVIAPDPVTLESQAENKETNENNNETTLTLSEVAPDHSEDALDHNETALNHGEDALDHGEDALNHHETRSKEGKARPEAEAEAVLNETRSKEGKARPEAEAAAVLNETGLKGGEVAEGNRSGPSSYKIRLINSDFRMGLEIKRDKLNKVMQQSYDVRSSFEPCIYPGVKIQFFWNADKAENLDGKCLCPTGTRCNGKGCGQGVGNCKKITIAVFQSGCIIITGALTTEQIDDAYTFICGVVEKHRSEIEKLRTAAVVPSGTTLPSLNLVSP